MFLACPITGLIDETNRLPSDYEQFIRELREILVGSVDRVFLALEREDWGSALMPAEICTPLDFEEMRRASVVVAYPGRSLGVCIELGWASAMGKVIVLLAPPEDPATPLIAGLPHLPEARVYRIPLDQEPSREAAIALRPKLESLFRSLRAEHRRHHRTRAAAPSPGS